MKRRKKTTKKAIRKSSAGPSVEEMETFQLALYNHAIAEMDRMGAVGTWGPLAVMGSLCAIMIRLMAMIMDGEEFAEVCRRLPGELERGTSEIRRGLGG